MKFSTFFAESAMDDLWAGFTKLAEAGRFRAGHLSMLADGLEEAENEYASEVRWMAENHVFPATNRDVFIQYVWASDVYSDPTYLTPYQLRKDDNRAPWVVSEVAIDYLATMGQPYPRHDRVMEVVFDTFKGAVEAMAKTRKTLDGRYIIKKTRGDEKTYLAKFFVNTDVRQLITIINSADNEHFDKWMPFYSNIILAGLMSVPDDVLSQPHNHNNTKLLFTDLKNAIDKKLPELIANKKSRDVIEDLRGISHQLRRIGL